MLSVAELLERFNAHLAGLNLQRSPRGLYEPVDYVLSLGGKRIRPILMLMAYNLYKEDVSAIFSPATAIEVYHNYTLLHDDLMDRADRRRGKPTVHKVWNDNVAILSGDAMLVLAYQYMAQVPEVHLQKVLALFSQTALEICEGQQLDMDFESRKDVTEAEYIEMIRLKTSVLLAASLKIGAILGGASDEDADRLYQFGMNLGVAFQLKDDLLDAFGRVEVFGKNIGGDILCNKKTYLLIQALEHADADQTELLGKWLDATDYDATEKINAVTMLYNQIGVKQLCESKILEYSDLASRNLEAVTLPQARKDELEQLMRKLMYREV
ncbi:MAG: polyprenyl synthetase family protein [Bacteroides sp.]|nr:polyprenyl synthetase family protein [Bacteroides sp.]